MVDEHAKVEEMTPLAVVTASEAAFKKLFADGMQLVNDTALYLDGPGREANKKLGLKASTLYHDSSGELTANLMRLASWLLLERAFREGEFVSRDALNKEKAKTRGIPSSNSSESVDISILPQELQALMVRSKTLALRVLKLEQSLKGPDIDASEQNRGDSDWVAGARERLENARRRRIP